MYILTGALRKAEQKRSGVFLKTQKSTLNIIRLHITHTTHCSKVWGW